MGSWRLHTDARAGGSFFSRVSLIASCLAALLMLISASHASVHDHDEHEGDHEGECVVCCVAALNGVKASPDDTAQFEPTGSLVGVRPIDRILIDDSKIAGANPARGPPFSILSC